MSSFIFDPKLPALLRQMTPLTVSGDPEWLPYDGPVAQVNAMNIIRVNVRLRDRCEFLVEQDQTC